MWAFEEPSGSICGGPKMKTTNKVAVLLLTIVMTGASQVVLAAECGFEFDSVELAITNAEFLGRKASTDEANMLMKLEAAKSKVIATKYDDAIGKLSDISDKATAMADAPKPKLADAGGINTALLDAARCINGLGK
jgi:hypothetical protein